MEQYILKSALVAIIEEQLLYYRELEDRGILSKEGSAAYRAIRILKSDIDALEVKEVDLNKELSYEDYKGFFEKYPDLSDDWGFDEAWIFANYFFELGMTVSNKAQKGE